MTHAAYAVLGDWTFAYARTTKTACGRRRKTDTLVSRDDATCPDCRWQIDADRAEFREMEQAAREAGLL